MKVKYLLLFLGMLPSLLSAQLSSSQWMLNGHTRYESNTIRNHLNEKELSRTEISIQPEIALMVSPNVQVNGQLNIDLDGTFSVVGQTIGGRYYFKNNPKTRLFAGLDFNWEKARQIRPVNGGGRAEFFKSNLDIGVLHFLNKNVALEMMAVYSFFNMRKFKENQRNNYIINSGIHLQAQVQYFFDSRKSPDNKEMERTFKKGKWMLGGYVLLNVDDNVNFDIQFKNRPNNDIAPFMAYFLNKNWAIGAHFRYWDKRDFRFFNLQLLPVSRYYISFPSNKKIFAELGFGIGMEFIRNGDLWLATNNQFIPRLGLGWTNMLTENVSFDIQAYYHYEYHKEFYGFDLSYKTIGIQLGLQAYLD